jgi:hypothetical protein
VGWLNGYKVENINYEQSICNPVKDAHAVTETINRYNLDFSIFHPKFEETMNELPGT